MGVLKNISNRINKRDKFLESLKKISFKSEADSAVATNLKKLSEAVANRIKLSEKSKSNQYLIPIKNNAEVAFDSQNENYFQWVRLYCKKASEARFDEKTYDAVLDSKSIKNEFKRLSSEITQNTWARAEKRGKRLAVMLAEVDFKTGNFIEQCSKLRKVTADYLGPRGLNPAVLPPHDGDGCRGFLLNVQDSAEKGSRNELLVACKKAAEARYDADEVHLDRVLEVPEVKKQFIRLHNELS